MRDLPAALTSVGWDATVLTPSYGMFHRLPGAQLLGTIDTIFRGQTQSLQVFEIPGSEDSVRNIAFEHPFFSPDGAGAIYSDDNPDRPFATDANKFAFFCTAAAEWIDQQRELPDIVHLHDWHAAFYCVLRNFADGYRRLRGIRTVFTIHNLSYQGIRPIAGDESSLESWFPDLRYTYSAIRDPHIAECVNPMATAIRLADMISTVSPTYATEICRPSNDEQGFIGGEGLEKELDSARQDGRLIGILNGCDYRNPSSRTHAIAKRRLASLPKRRPKNLLTSVGRLVRQKAALFFEEMPDGRVAIEHVLDVAGKDGVFILLGSGEPEYEQRMVEIAERADNLLFLCGFSTTLADPIYHAGDLFLMPSSFEPCGISQMLAMRFAQPCVVHGVGGLKDTVKNERSGFVFEGNASQQQAAHFIETVELALSLKANDHDRWQSICIRAASERFSWNESARQTVENLYEH